MCCNLLGQAGLRVVGIEKGECDPARFRPRAIVCDDESLRLFQAVGLAEKLVPTLHFKPGLQFVTSSYLHGGPCVKLNGPGVGGGRMGDFEKVTESDLMPVGPQGWRSGAAFYQPALEGILFDGVSRFSNVERRLTTKVESVEQTGDAVTIRTRPSKHRWHQTEGGEWIMKDEAPDDPLEGAETVTAKLVVSCDGAASKMREKMNPDHLFGFKSLGFNEDWCVLDVMLTDDSLAEKMPKYTHQVCDPRRPQTFVPGSRIWDHPKQGRHLRWEFRVLPNDDRKAFMMEENMHNLVSEWGLQRSDYEIVRYAMYQFHSCIAPKWVDANITLCGDSCHTTPPFMGQGMNQGFKDAANLCWKVDMVARGLAPPSLLESYPTERYNRVMWMVERAVQVGKMINEFSQAELDGTQPDLMEKYRNAGYVGVQGGTVVGAGNPPVAPESPLQGPGEGDAFTGRWLCQPHEALRTADGREGRLDDLIGGYRFALVARSAAAAEALSPASRACLARLGAAVLQLALSDAERASACAGLFAGLDCALVRPDRVIFGAGLAEEGDALVGKLQSRLGL